MSLQVSFGQYTDKGRKALNQDFHGATIPKEPLLGSKGIGMALADGISSSDVSQFASQTAIQGFFEDYYSTPDSWSVKTSAQRVLLATNSWLHAQTRNGPWRYDLNRGYVCTFSALIFKSNTAHVFHIGDARVYRVIDRHLEQLTEDHRLWLSDDQSYLSRALGMRDRLEIDYQAFQVEAGDTFVLATDGVYEFAPEAFVLETVREHHDDLDRAARLIADEALRLGSHDNLTVQIARVDQLPHPQLNELHEQVSALPLPPELRARMIFDGYEIVRELHGSNRSHVYLAVDTTSSRRVILKLPSMDLRDDPAYLDRFLMEEWVARRIDSPHVLKPCEHSRRRNYVYIVTEFIEGQTLTQWMADHPRPDLEAVRDIIEQIARGLQALHRQEMLHQDLRPNNVMIDHNGTIKIIDFGSVRVAGIAEMGGPEHDTQILGTAQYTAPEYFVGEAGTNRSDLFSLGVIAYQMLCGRLPYGVNVAKTSSRGAQRRLVYHPVLDYEGRIPAWIDGALRKAVHVDPLKRYGEISEFLYDLRHPNPAYLRKQRPPLLQRHPVRFWQGVSLLLFVALVYLLIAGAGFHR
jgi:serine/threonine protein phosphatase PrpC